MSFQDNSGLGDNGQMRVALALLLPLAVHSQSIDWNRTRPEILQRFQDLVRIDTSSPPGNETKAVEYVCRALESEGIPCKVFAMEPSRANAVARIKGSGRKRPLLFLAHTDVVGVQREKWPVDPFGAVLKDGYVWGRGTVDDKPHLAAGLMLMLLLKRTGLALDRDVIFLAESGEEGNHRVGINYMVEHHFAEIDAEYALTEGGGATIEGDRVVSVKIETTEKIPRGVKLVARGTSGHGSRPRTDNAVTRIGAAVAKLGAWQTPMRLNDTTRAYFERLATISPPDKAARYNGISDPARADAIQRYFAEHEPGHYSMLRTSVVPTQLRAGFRINVIPSEAEALVDIRVLPDEDWTRFMAEMRRVIGDPGVEISSGIDLVRPAAPPSRLDTEMFRVLEAVAKRMNPGAAVLPTMSTGATDMAQLRARGVQAYGIGPAATEDDTTNFGAHSDVERLREESLYRFVEYVWEVSTAIAKSTR
jgi:acetylornithine deacetylase/succinyl-diaminopimelate desuccinylase-like protein